MLASSVLYCRRRFYSMVLIVHVCCLLGFVYILAYERFYQVLLSIGQISLICLSVHLCLCFNFLMVWVFVFIIVLLGFWLTGFCACR